MTEPLSASTLTDETSNLRQIASELAERPDLTHWALTNTDISNHVGAIHKLYPWLPPGVTLALGTARYGATDPFVKQLADQVMALGRKSSPEIAGLGVEQGIAPGISGVSLKNGGGIFDKLIDPIGHGLSDVGHFAGKMAEQLGSDIPGPVRGASKAVARGTFGVLQAPLEGVEALGRTSLASMQFNKPLIGNRSGGILGHLEGDQIRGDTTAPILPQITLAQQISGKGAGQGFFPGGAAHQAAVHAQVDAASIGGHALTIGRGVAGSVLPANSNAYRLLSGLTDAGVGMYADPSAYALQGVGALREARAGVAAPGTDWGWADRLRQTIGIQTASEQLDSNVGQGIIGKLTTLNTSRSVYHFLGKKVDPQIAAQLAHANTPEAVRAILDNPITGLGTGIQKLPAFHPLLQSVTSHVITDDFGNPIESGAGSLGYAVDRATRNWRPLAELPSGTFPTDVTQSWVRTEAYRQAENFLLNAKVPAADMDAVLDRIATATNRNQMYDAFGHMTDVTADNLVRDYAMTKQQARTLTRAYSMSDDVHDLTRHFAANLSDQMEVPGALVGGQPVHFDGSLPTEMLQNNIPMPNFREIRRAASTYRKVIRAIPGGKGILQGVDYGTAALDSATHVWKGMQLLRPAFVFRVGAESQLATAAAGDTSAFRHPFDFIAHGIGRTAGTDIVGDELGPLDFAQVFRTAPRGITADADRLYANQWELITKTSPRFTDAWAQEIRHMSLDDIGRATAKALVGEPEASGARTVDGLKQAFWDGALRKVRVNMIENDPKRWQTYLTQRAVSDQYVDQQVQRIRLYAQDDPELLAAMASGKFREDPLAELGSKGGQKIGAGADRAPQSLRDRLNELQSSGVSPDYMKSHLAGSTKLGANASIAKMYDKAVARGFKMLNTASLRDLGASSAFRQEYYREIDRLLPFMDPDEAARAVANAEAAGVTGLSASKAAGSLDAQSATMIAKSRALDKMTEILHDLGHRSQLSDMVRFIFPFGDAYQKTMMRWVKLVGEHPQNLERFRQGLAGAESSSFVHKDPQSGKLVVTVPFSAQVDQLIAGVPFPMSAPLNGFSIVGEGMPGVGPAVSIPFEAVAPHVPILKDIADTLIPYGAPNIKQGLMEAFLPAWAQRFRTADIGPFGASPDQRSVFTHSVGEVLRWGVSTGKYKIDTPGHIASAVADARHKAKMLYMVRGAIQSTFPSPPQVEYMVKDKNGRMLNVYLLTNELQNLYAGKGVDGKGENDPAQAAQLFLKLHGEQNYLSLQAFTTPRRYGLPTTKAAAEWLVAHPSFRKEFPNVYGLLSPQKGAFDYGTYLTQIESGDRVDRTSGDYVQLGNARIAAMIYDTERDKLPDDASASDKANYLGQLRDWLKAKYPGYQAQELQVEKASVPDAVAELGKAVTDPIVARTDAAKATREYLVLRQQVIDFEKQNGSGVTTNALSQSAEFEPQAEWLSAQATKLIDRYPTFFPVWDQLLSHEVTLKQPNPAGV